MVVEKLEEVSSFLKDNIFFNHNCYIGIQLIKLLLKHNNINIKYLCGSSSVGKSISNYDKTVKNYKLPKIKKFSFKYLNNIDVVFTALPNGEAQKISNY